MRDNVCKSQKDGRRIRFDLQVVWRIILVTPTSLRGWPDFPGLLLALWLPPGRRDVGPPSVQWLLILTVFYGDGEELIRALTIP